MPRNEDGEFELILGNRQLLSVFFIVVILLGVFFTVGYIIGRSSAPVLTADASSALRNDSPPLVVESAAPPAQAEPPSQPQTKQPVTTAQQQPPEPARKEDTPPAKAEAPKPPAPKAQAKAETKTEPPKPAPPKPTPAKPAPPETAKAASAAGGIYLQLSATKKPEAETYVDVLKKRGFPAMASQVPENDTLFRVLVGPLAEANVNKVRADLQGAGFPGDKAIRKKF